VPRFVTYSGSPKYRKKVVKKDTLVVLYLNDLASMIEFMARTGVRVAEMANIRLTDIKMNGGEAAYIRIHGKGDIERDIEVERKFVESIIAVYVGSEYLFEHQGKQYSTISITNRIKAVSEVGIGKRISAYALRHSYARHQIVDMHRSAKAFARQLGHSSTAITMDFYVEDKPSDEEGAANPKLVIDEKSGVVQPDPAEAEALRGHQDVVRGVWYPLSPSLPNWSGRPLHGSPPATMGDGGE